MTLDVEGYPNGCFLTNQTPAPDGRSLAFSCNFNAATGQCTFMTNTGTPQSQFPGWGFLRRGDTVLRTFHAAWKEWLYVMNWSHAAVYNTSPSAEQQTVYEALSTGVHVTRVSDFLNGSPDVAFGFDTVASLSSIGTSLDMAHARYMDDDTTGYNWDWWRSKDDDSPGVGSHGPHNVYCSQLPYKVNSFSGVNIDSNNKEYALWVAAHFGLDVAVVAKFTGVVGAAVGFVFGGAVGLTFTHVSVAPDEIGASGNMRFYYSGHAPPPP